MAQIAVSLIRIHHVISEITGATGLAIVDAIPAGERDPAVLAKLRDYRVQASEEVVRKSLEGNWKAEHLDHEQRSPLRLILDKTDHASSPLVKRAMKRSKNW